MSYIPLGIFAVAGAGSGVDTGSYEQIATTVLTVNTTSVTLASIPGTYKHLQVRAVLQNTAGSGLVTEGIRVNGDSAANYSSHEVVSTGSSVTTSSNTSNSMMQFICSGIQVTDSFTAFIMDFPNYSNTSTFKTMNMFMGMGQTAGSGTRVGIVSGNWRSTAAINSINIFEMGSNAFRPGSRFSVYGIKG
jgi:hypothetical protein